MHRICYPNGGTVCRSDDSTPVNGRLPLAGRRWALVDSVPEQVLVHQSCDHVEFVVEPADGLVVRVRQARVSLESSDGMFYAHLGGVDPVVVLLLLGSQDPVVF